MKNSFILLFFWEIIACFFSFCKKETRSSTPEIEFIAASKSTIFASQDTLRLTIKYRDGDGDLGENNPDVVNCFVQDSRAPGLLYKLRIQQLAPTGSKIAIQGQLELQIPPTGLLDGSKSEELVVFSIKIIDRAGNESNLVQSSTIRVVP